MSEIHTHIRAAAASEIPCLVATAQAAQNKLTCGGSVQQVAGYSARNIRERMEHGELFILEVSGSIIGSAFVEPVTPNYAAFTLMPGLACTASFLKRTSKSRFSSGTYHRPKRVLSIEILEKRRN